MAAQPPQLSPEAEIDLEELSSEQLDAAAGPPRYELFTYPADFTLEVLHQKWRNGDIVVPSLQRAFVWTQMQASRLIESFLLGLPVPSVFFYSERATEKFLVVDGQQRLRSVFYFFEGSFGEERLGKRSVFRLQLPEPSPWSGMTFTDLPDDDALRLKNSVLRAFVMKQVNPADDTSIYHVFERLNTGGTSLTAQEVRNSVYAGPFNELLLSLNELPEWREIVGRPLADTRLKDVELILRFFALLVRGDAYEKPMKTFLTDFMKAHKGGDLNATLESVFVTTAKNVRQHLGTKPFHLRTGLNVPVFDAVFVAVARHNGDVPADAEPRFQNLLKDEDFVKWTSRATTDVDAVKKRIGLALKYFFE